MTPLLLMLSLGGCKLLTFEPDSGADTGETDIFGGGGDDSGGGGGGGDDTGGGGGGPDWAGDYSGRILLMGENQGILGGDDCTGTVDWAVVEAGGGAFDVTGSGGCDWGYVFIFLGEVSFSFTGRIEGDGQAGGDLDMTWDTEGYELEWSGEMDDEEGLSGEFSDDVDKLVFGVPGLFGLDGTFVAKR